jgi:tetratricopeptide (TPR) repeat protein
LQCQARQDLETLAAQEPDRGDPRTDEQRQLDADIAAADEERLHGNLKKALAAFQALLPRVRQQAPGERLALFLAKLSTAARLTGDTRLAMATAEEAESAAVACGSDRGRGHAILSRGDVLLHSGRFDEALAAFKAAEALSEKTGDDLGRGNATLDRGRALLQLGRCDEALAAFKAADALSEKAGDDLGRGNATWSRGEALFHLGRTEEALAAFKAAETLYEKVGDDIGRGNATRDRGRALCSMGEVDAGLAAMLEGHQMEVTVGCLHNAAISARRYLDALAAALEAPGGRERTKYWPGQVEAVAGHLKDSERVRGALVRLATAAFRHLTPRQLVDGLPAVEALLPPEYSTLLAPVRLAGEVRLGMRDERLPEEPDEMRRLVRELLK